ncbi:hypothetical protein GHT06_013032 [Daphnia sinensis]|uniref:Uncharacterized protein n=1 Tax=Daphnia sinensis TaxID=1820382 RepID=A0AAD5PWN6_9CRUS|nr:hypothetical protein GHT06_013032 [Daphnia sinensis]
MKTKTKTRGDSSALSIQLRSGYPPPFTESKVEEGGAGTRIFPLGRLSGQQTASSPPTQQLISIYTRNTMFFTRAMMSSSIIARELHELASNQVSGKHSGRIRLSLDSKMLARSCRESCIVKSAQLLPSRVYTRPVLKIGQSPVMVNRPLPVTRIACQLRTNSNWKRSGLS